MCEALAMAGDHEMNPMEASLASGDVKHQMAAAADAGDEVGKAMAIASVAINLTTYILTANALPLHRHFPNDVVTVGGLTRAVRSLRAALHLTWTGYPEESLALIRLAYESAGLARVLGKDPQGADDWLMGGHQWPDRRVRRWIERQRGKGAAAEFEKIYKDLSAYAHPSPISIIRRLDIDGDTVQPRLETEYEERAFHHNLWLLAQTAIFVMFCTRNAAAGEQGESLPSGWHEDVARLIETYEEWTGVAADAARLRGYAEDHARKFTKLQQELGRTSDLDDTLDADPHSWRNLSRQVEAEPDVDPSG